MKNLLILLVLIASISNLKADTYEVCYYGLYVTDTNELVLESDSKAYLESIEHEYKEQMTIEISQCESEEQE